MSMEYFKITLKFKNQINLYLLPVIFIFVQMNASAQNDSIDFQEMIDVHLYELSNMNVSGVSRFHQSLLDAPACVRIITKKEIEDKGFDDLSDVLRHIGSIDYVDNARGFGEFYIFRGIESNDRFLILIDGEKINPPSGTFLSVGNSISLGFASRIEIIFGPSAVIYGADAYAGVINIISETPNNNEVLSTLDYGSMNTKDASVYATYKADKWSFSAFGRMYKSDGPDFTGRDTTFNQISRYPPEIGANFRQPINDHTVFLKATRSNFSFSYFRKHFDEGNALGTATSSNIYSEDNKWAVTTNQLSLKFNKEIWQNYHLNVDVNYLNNIQSPETQFYKWKQNYNFEAGTYSQYITGLDHNISTSANMYMSFGKFVDVITGIDAEYSWIIPPYANDQLFAQSLKYEGEIAELINNELQIEETRFGLFSQFTVSPIDELMFIIGGRFDASSKYNKIFNPRVGFIV